MKAIEPFKAPSPDYIIGLLVLTFTFNILRSRRFHCQIRPCRNTWLPVTTFHRFQVQTGSIFPELSLFPYVLEELGVILSDSIKLKAHHSCVAGSRVLCAQCVAGKVMPTARRAPVVFSFEATCAILGRTRSALNLIKSWQTKQQSAFSNIFYAVWQNGVRKVTLCAS